jgi:hypothetical protein
MDITFDAFPSRDMNFSDTSKVNTEPPIVVLDSTDTSTTHDTQNKLLIVTSIVARRCRIVDESERSDCYQDINSHRVPVSHNKAAMAIAERPFLSPSREFGDR